MTDILFDGNERIEIASSHATIEEALEYLRENRK